MDISRIRKALHEDGAGAVASGTSATPGPGAIGGGIQPFKAKMGSWRRKKKTNEWVDPQNQGVEQGTPQSMKPGVEQSTQHASDAQLGNPMKETTHEEVNLFDEERIAFSETPLKPFSGLQLNDFEAGINQTFDQIKKIVNYNLSNTTDPTNKNLQSLKAKYETFKSNAYRQLDTIIKYIEANKVKSSEREINLSDAYQLMSLVNAYGDIDGQEPIAYAKHQADRLLDIAKGDALEAAQEVIRTKSFFNTSNPDDEFNDIEYILPSDASRLLIAMLTQQAIEGDRWGEALFWNKLRKTIETYNWSDDDRARAAQQDSRGEEVVEPDEALIGQ